MHVQIIKHLPKLLKTCPNYRKLAEITQCLTNLSNTTQSIENQLILYHLSKLLNICPNYCKPSQIIEHPPKLLNISKNN